MSSRRWLTKLTVPVVFGAALTTGTAIAFADANDDTYRSKLHALGLNWQSSGDYDIISMGHGICSDRLAGKTPDAIAADLRTQLSSKGYSFANTRGMVNAAVSAYCPD